MFPTPFRRISSTWLPRSLRGQFTLALLVLSILMTACGAAAVYALRSSSEAIETLTQERAERLKTARDIVGRTWSIENDADLLLSGKELAVVRSSYAAIVREASELDALATRLAESNGETDVLDLLEASQLFRNTANVVAQLREDALRGDQVFADRLAGRIGSLAAGQDAEALILYRVQDVDSTAAVEDLRIRFSRLRAARHAAPGALSVDDGEPFALRIAQLGQHDILARYHQQLAEQAAALVSMSIARSAVFDEQYRVAGGQLIEASRRQQRWVLVLLASSLVFAWAVAGVFLGRRVLGRLHQVSRHLQRRSASGAVLENLVGGQDEIGDRARAVDRFLADRALLESRTEELVLTREYSVEQGRVLEMIASGKPLADVLDQLTRLVEMQLDGIRASVLLLDDDDMHLRHGIGPHLPAAYMEAIEGVAIGPGVGSCGTAAYLGKTVIVSDIQSNALWKDFAALATLHGLRSCWSAPILSLQDKVLGTFAMYSSEVRSPSAQEVKLVELATRIAGIAIERHRAERRIRHMAHHDELTGLPNRSLLNDSIAKGLLHAQETGCQLGLLLVDLDGFKFINDSFGHPVGDAVLVAVAKRLAGAVRRGDTVARLGGDEFVVMLSGLERADDAMKAAGKILGAVSRPMQIESRSLNLHASIGVSVCSGGEGDGETLLKQADVALYRAKQLGRDRYQCYSEDMGRQAQEHMRLMTALRGALQAGQFTLHYQPQVDLRSGRVTSMEALIRWQHPELGLVSPARFIPLAEESGLIVAIGEWVLRTACAQMQAWRMAGHAGLTVAVNLSARQFQGHDVATLVRRVLDDCALPARFLELELTESALMLDPDSVLQTLLELKAIGIVLALDDFGTGYSSLSHLRRFPIDVIKIDQSFTFDVASNEDAASITRAIIAMAKSLGVQTVAEGVETDAQLQFMAENRCDRMQGYYFSRPLPVDAMSALLEADRRLTVPAGALQLVMS